MLGGYDGAGSLLDEGSELRHELRRRVIRRHAGGDDDRDVGLAVPRLPPLQNLHGRCGGGAGAVRGRCGGGAGAVRLMVR